MKNQGPITTDAVFGPPVDVPADRTTTLAGSAAMQDRLVRIVSHPSADVPFLLAAEHVTSLLVDLPPASARQRAAMLAFAAEDRIAAPLDATLVAAGPVNAPAGTPQLIFVVGRGVIDACPDTASQILPEYLLIRRPASGWAVWRDGDRCLVRAEDGTGFAASSAMLPLLWKRAGQPQLVSLAAPLPADLPFEDVAGEVPAPDPIELSYSLPHVRPGDAARVWRPFVVAAMLVVLGLAVHLGLLALDVAALDRIAKDERATAQAAIAEALPGVTVSTDVGPVLARLAPSAAPPAGSAVLPLLSDTATALAAIDPTATFRRLAWGAGDDVLVILVQASGLDALQAIERGLGAAGFTVRSGAASAGDGGAEAELRISRGAT